MLNRQLSFVEKLPRICISIPQKSMHKYKVDYVVRHYDGIKKSRLELSKLCGFSENYIYKSVIRKNKINK